MTTDGNAPEGPNLPGVLPRIRKPPEGQMWQCRVCGYNRNIDKVSSQCLQCGRDFWGNPGTVPTDLQPHTPGLRGD
jgi:hypothetical protein